MMVYRLKISHHSFCADAGFLAFVTIGRNLSTYSTFGSVLEILTWLMERETLVVRYEFECDDALNEFMGLVGSNGKYGNFKMKSQKCAFYPKRADMLGFWVEEYPEMIV